MLAFQTNSMEIEDVLAEDLLEFIDEDDELLDRLFHDAMATEAATDPAPSVSPPPPQSSVEPPQRFRSPVDDETIKAQQLSAIPGSTLRDTKYCLQVWKEWRKHHQESTNSNIPEVCELTPGDMNHWFQYFVLEIRKKDSTEYPPNSLLHICLGFFRHLRTTTNPIKVQNPRRRFICRHYTMHCLTLKVPRTIYTRHAVYTAHARTSASLPE